MLIISFRHHFSNLVRCTIVIKKIILKSTFKDNREYFYIKCNLFQDREGTIWGETSLASFHHLPLSESFLLEAGYCGAVQSLRGEDIRQSPLCTLKAKAERGAEE